MPKYDTQAHTTIHSHIMKWKCNRNLHNHWHCQWHCGIWNSWPRRCSCVVIQVSKRLNSRKSRHMKTMSWTNNCGLHSHPSLCYFTCHKNLSNSLELTWNSSKEAVVSFRHSGNIVVPRLLKTWMTFHVFCPGTRPPRASYLHRLCQTPESLRGLENVTTEWRGEDEWSLKFWPKYPFKVCQRLFWSGSGRPAAGVERRRWAEVLVESWSLLLWIRKRTRGPLAPPAALLYSSGLWSVSFLLLIWLLSVCVRECVYVCVRVYVGVIGDWGGQRMGNEMGSEKWKMDALVRSHRENCLAHSSANDNCHPQVSTLSQKITVGLSQKVPQRSADSQICSEVIRLKLAAFGGKNDRLLLGTSKKKKMKKK